MDIHPKRVAWAVVALLGAGIAVGPSLPYGWTHALDKACNWHTRPYVSAWVADRPDTPAQRAEFACWHSHGLMSPTPFVKTIMVKWPTPEQRAEWSTQ